jgi:hypothetical protein
MCGHRGQRFGAQGDCSGAPWETELRRLVDAAEMPTQRDRSEGRLDTAVKQMRPIRDRDPRRVGVALYVVATPVVVKA